MAETLLTALAMTLLLLSLAASFAVRARLLSRHDELLRRAREDGTRTTDLVDELVRDTLLMKPSSGGRRRP